MMYKYSIQLISVAIYLILIKGFVGMESIVFIDLEVNPNSNVILDMGAVKNRDDKFHSKSKLDFVEFLKGSKYLCGHNIINHDLKYMKNLVKESGISADSVVDTLHLSALLFPKKPYHALVKDEKLQSDELNNPLTDAIKCRDLFLDEVSAFRNLDDSIKQIFFLLLYDQDEFRSFFQYIGYRPFVPYLIPLIKKTFVSEICENVNFNEIIKEHPVALAYALAIINVKDRFSVTPSWILKNYPEFERIMNLLRNRPCITGCSYCDQALDAQFGLKRFFGFESYRTFDGEPLQEESVKAAINNKSLLAIFPTGGGKSLAFQVPALMSGENVKGLTVIISPLQSLMKDQVDNLEKVYITDAVTINGLLDPIERAQSIERVKDGSASMLYISPETLRSRTIEHILMGRKIVRFVIDEAHCFSSWGQDFRVDYLYIGDFIKNLQEKKNLDEGIPVSCFTATAKLKVIEDIKTYFLDKLSIELEVFSASSTRDNLHYRVFEKNDQEGKYSALRNLIEQNQCPTIVYVSRTNTAYELAERLSSDGYLAKPYHGRMDKTEKSENQDAFMAGDVSIMVATSAFGMGVDKKDVGMVIHYEISNSLENYVQEAGRAGRDENITAECYILYDENDLDKHFALLNQTKLNINEIQQVWKAIKDITPFRMTVSKSALEIANKAGWDETVNQVEMRVRTAINALEESGYIKRGQDMPRVYADSIQCKNAQEAVERINASYLFDDNGRLNAVRIIKTLISSKNISLATESEAESRVDYIAEQLGIEKEKVIEAINLMREIGILADSKDLMAYINKGGKAKNSLQVFRSFIDIEEYLIETFEEEEATYNIKELNEGAEEAGCKNVTPNRIMIILNYLAIKRLIKYKKFEYSKNHLRLLLIEPKIKIRKLLKDRQETGLFVVEYLHEIASNLKEDVEIQEVLVNFSVHELKEAYEGRMDLFRDTDEKISISTIEDTLFYLSRIEALKIDGGFLVIYNPMTIERLEEDNRIRYKLDDYRKLEEFYENKVLQIHIVGEYAKKMIDNYKEALQFVSDYFVLNNSSFMSKYFKGDRVDEIRKNISPGKFKQLFGELSPTQLKIINDKDDYITVLAGPGSGKTRVLVHKLASLVLMEDVKLEQLLMLTFSRAAATEFKKRLIKLVGATANYIDIKTFHSYCFDLLGRVGDAERSDNIIKETKEKIISGDVELQRITKTVLVIDEAQDMDEDVYALVQTLMEYNEDLRVIAVGDDDQNIFEFRGSSAKYMEDFMLEKQATTYELLENYRSKKNLVEFFNKYSSLIKGRLKKNEIVSHSQVNGDIKIVKYRHDKLLVPLVRDICSTELIGSTCILTTRNDEALQVAGMLLKEGVPAKLIQSNDDFRIYNLVELRFFLDQLKIEPDTPVISDDTWDKAKRSLFMKYEKSELLDICKKIIFDFESIYIKKKYISDFEVFIKESKLEDFYSESGEIVYVSTIHKAKGKEFDNIFLLLEDFKMYTEEQKRQVYVAMTRAKNNLTIHLNGSYLDGFKAENLTRLEDNNIHELPEKMATQLNYRDVWLGYFKRTQDAINLLQSGDVLNYCDGGLVTVGGEKVLKFSKAFGEKIEAILKNGYEHHFAKVNFIVYWWDEEEDIEIKIVLPELHFKRNG